MTQIQLHQLAAHLDKGVRPLYALHGDEALLQQEAQDAIRAAARAQGYTERSSHTVAGAHFDWSAVLAAGGSLSLFADRQIVEIRIPSGKPGKDGAAALQQIAASAQGNDSTLTIVLLPRLDRATKTARQMVTELGMSDRLGLVKLGRKREEIFLGRDISEDRDYSEEVAYAIDQEVKAIIDSCYAKAKEILLEKKDLLDKIAAVLLERETLDGNEFDALMNGEDLPEKKTSNGNEKNGKTERPEDEAPEVPGLPEERVDGVPKNEFLA